MTSPNSTKIIHQTVEENGSMKVLNKNTKHMNQMQMKNNNRNEIMNIAEEFCEQLFTSEAKKPPTQIKSKMMWSQKKFQ